MHLTFHCAAHPTAIKQCYLPLHRHSEHGRHSYLDFKPANRLVVAMSGQNPKPTGRSRSKAKGRFASLEPFYAECEGKSIKWCSARDGEVMHHYLLADRSGRFAAANGGHHDAVFDEESRE